MHSGRAYVLQSADVSLRATSLRIYDRSTLTHRHYYDAVRNFRAELLLLVMGCGRFSNVILVTLFTYDFDETHTHCSLVIRSSCVCPAFRMLLSISNRLNFQLLPRTLVTSRIVQYIISYEFRAGICVGSQWL